ncbi:MFS transporter [Williamsia muralis]|uniref:MFS transporter n=1 Tax=Williamsia marianensis TaxID=85044 RepID=UPI00382E250B
MTTTADPAVPEHTDLGTPLALSALLTGTLVGTLSNNIVNVPLAQILSDFDAPLQDGVLVAVGFLLTFAAAMPLAGYIGDRFGRRRVYCGALLATAVCSAGAATAPNLATLIAWRSLGGLAAAAFAPAVMGLIAWLFGPERRARAVGAWASVNGIGQAIGPSLGGLIAGTWGWRWVFVPMIPMALIGFAGTMRWIPAYQGRRMRLDIIGASALTVGSAVLVLGLTLVPQPRVPVATDVALIGISVLLLGWFVWHARRVAEPFVDVRLASESRFVRSAVAACAQMFCLGSALLSVPLYLSGTGESTVAAGLVLFALPAVMALLAPIVGRTTDSLGARRVLRVGLGLLVMSQVVMAVVMAESGGDRWAVVGALVIAGIGIALVQTPAAAGSTRSPAGAQGTGLGLFNLIRFGGSALGAAWVAIAIDSWSYAGIFVVCAVVATLALISSFLGHNPEEQPAQISLAVSGS